MSLMVTIPSGSFFLSHYLNQAIASKTITDDELVIALELALPAAYKKKLTMLKEESPEWFYFAKKIAYFDNNYALRLATIYQMEGQNKESIFWYKKAITLNHAKAAFKLAEYYLSLNKLDDAKALLLRIDNKNAFTRLIEIAVTQGDIEYIEEQLIHLEDLNLIRLLEYYQVVTLPGNNGAVITERSGSLSSKTGELICENSVQLFATNLPNLQRLESLIDQASEHKLSNLFCFGTPKYIPITQLNCTAEAEYAIECVESSWSEYEQAINSRYIGLMLDDGGANVNNGILYIDKHDDVNVFTHELSHLLGFIDEYALPENHLACQSVQSEAFAHNVVILPISLKGDKEDALRKLKSQIPWAEHIDSDTPILTNVKGKWQIGTPYSDESNHANDIGLYEVNTCNNEKLKAFKPVKQVTQLNYYEEPFPLFYSERAHKEPNRFSMPSYHYNIAKAFFKNGEDIKGIKWLAHSLKREQINSLKYKKIKRGEY